MITEADTDNGDFNTTQIHASSVVEKILEDIALAA